MKVKLASGKEAKVQKLRAKALRRGEKLANTLRKLTAKGDPNDAPMERLLKELERALPQMRPSAGRQEGEAATRETKRLGRASGRTGHEPPSPPKTRSRKVKRQPASAPSAAE